MPCRVVIFVLTFLMEIKQGLYFCKYILKTRVFVNFDIGFRYFTKYYCSIFYLPIYLPINQC